MSQVLVEHKKDHHISEDITFALHTFAIDLASFNKQLPFQPRIQTQRDTYMIYDMAGLQSLLLCCCLIQCIYQSSHLLYFSTVFSLSDITPHLPQPPVSLRSPFATLFYLAQNFLVSVIRCNDVESLGFYNGPSTAWD